MRTLIIQLFLSLILSITLFSCDNGGSAKKADPCEDVICEEWQSCAAGECVLQEGRCENYTHCADDMFCDDALHTCRGPRQPADDFLGDLEGNSVAFSFAGIINPGTTTDPTLGAGTYTFDVGELTGVINEYAYTFEFTYPEDYPNPSVTGLEVLSLGTSKIYGQNGPELDYYHFNWVVAKSVLLAARTADDPVLEAPDLARFRLMDVNQYVRQWDQTLFRRYCTISSYDTAASTGRLFLDFFDNTSFSAGEDLKIWGNLPLTPLIQITSENEEAQCLYRIKDAYVTREDYETERAITEPALSCEIPADFFDGAVPMHLDYFFSGELNPSDASLESAVPGYGDATAMLQEEVIVDDYNSVALDTTVESVPITYAQSIGSVTTVGTDHYRFYIMGVYVATSVLQTMKQDQTTVVPWDAETMSVALESYEQLAVDGVGYGKVCPVAVSGPDAIGDLLACTGENVDFSVGETLELALSVTWTDDATSIAAVYSYADGQTCHCLQDNAIIDCAVFDALLARR